MTAEAAAFNPSPPYRVFQWALPIPVGWGVVWNWRRKIKRGDLPDPFAAPPQEAGAA